MAAVPPAIPQAREIPSLANFPPPIAAVEYNTIPSNEDVVQETKHVMGVKKAHDLGIGVTADEYGDRIKRHHMIVARSAGQGAAPFWLDALRMELGAHTEEIRALMEESRAQMGVLGAQVGVLGAQVAQSTVQMEGLAANVNQLMGITLQLTATSANQGHKQANRRIRDHMDNVFQLCKVIPGTPHDPPFFAPNNFDMPQFDNAPQVNETPADHGIYFPVAVHNLPQITRAQIATLSVFYNEDFGIVGDDNVSMMAAKFVTFTGR